MGRGNIWNLIGKYISDGDTTNEAFINFSLIGITLATCILVVITLKTIRISIRSLAVSKYKTDRTSIKPHYLTEDIEKEMEQILKGMVKTKTNYLLTYLKLQKRTLFIYMIVLILTYVIFVGGY